MGAIFPFASSPDALSSYVPVTLLRHLGGNFSWEQKPAVERLSTALMFIDIAGFTRMTEKLRREKTDGVETISEILNIYFACLIETITAHGGDIVQFAGDALLVLWPESEEQTPLTSITLRAARCALEIQSRIRSLVLPDDLRFSIRISLGAGNILLTYLGGIRSQWYVLVTGAPLSQLNITHSHTEPGQVVASLQAWAPIREYCSATQGMNGTVCIHAVHALEEPRPLIRPSIDKKIEAKLAHFLPASLRQRLLAGDHPWCAELRRATVLFLNLPELNYATPLERAQQIMCAVQQVIHIHDGAINKLSVDEKGASLLVAFGMPSNTHEDDPARAVRCGFDAYDALAALGFRCSIGIATGEVFCGPIGSDIRRDFTLIGDIVNIAARLMQVAAGEILCDEKTSQVIHLELHCEALPAIFVKGKVDLMPVFRPLRQLPAHMHERPVIVGRKREKAVLRDRLAFFSAGALGTPVIVEGDAGVGKSVLLRDAADFAKRLGCTIAWGGGLAIEQHVPFHAWKAVFQSIFFPSATIPSALGPALGKEVLERYGVPFDLAPLLNTVSGLRLPDSQLTKSMRGLVRAENTQELLLKVLEHAARPEPFVIFMEDLHWCDSASLGLLARLSMRKLRVLACISTRPLADDASPLHWGLLQSAGTTHIALRALTPEDSVQLICSRLGTTKIPEEVGAYIYSRAKGHPLFTEELACGLQEQGTLEIVNGDCRLGASDKMQDLENLPDNLKSAVWSRVDRLTFLHQQMLLRVGSVLGASFEIPMLTDVYPLRDATPAALTQDLSSLLASGFIEKDLSTANPRLMFKHALIQEAIYGLLLPSQKQALHERAARWFERHEKGRRSRYYVLLAHHWKHAGDLRRALFYLEKAGATLVRTGAFDEAILALEQLIRADIPWRIHPHREARWRRLLAEAHWGKGNLLECSHYLDQATRAAKCATPQRIISYLPILLGQTLLQLWHRRGNFKNRASRQRFEELRIERGKIFIDAVEISYFMNRKTDLLLAAVRAANACEYISRQDLRAKSFATLGTVLGIVGRHRASSRYISRAKKMLEGIDDLRVRGHVLKYIMVYALGLGNWQEAFAVTSEACDIFYRLGDKVQWAQTKGALAKVYLYQGQYAEAGEIERELCEEAERNGTQQFVMWGLVWQAVAFFRARQFEEMRHFVHEARVRLNSECDEPTRVTLYALYACLLQHDNEDPAKIRGVVCDALEILKKENPATFYSLDGMIILSEVCRQLEHGQRQGALTAATLGILKKFARKFPIAKAYTLFLRGHQSACRGHANRARSLWRRGLEEARLRNMQYEIMLLERAMGL